jgi:hypothetical protein
MKTTVYFNKSLARLSAECAELIPDAKPTTIFRMALREGFAVLIERFKKPVSKHPARKRLTRQPVVTEERSEG